MQAKLKWGVIPESLHIHHSTAAQYIYKIDCDVTRLVATERVRNKYSLWRSFTLYCNSVILINWQRQFDSTLAQ